ncbi:hypothetical protein ASG73_01975 [Janibacter sp. Soil728]|uniref:DUF5701 family protein n=1 Tax=Janibacter sp. Soil728 TaxID=1736393 RepID=UPI0006F49001|nr:DUF5701 family protein [Janibacter sp. Soil728]KRE39142.1 hypothetical protein ASG73_01975 [Janibacter sp. Soil728]
MTADAATQTACLVELGVPALAGITDAAFADLVPDAPGGDGVLVVHPSLVSAADLARLLALGDTPGFVVEDLTDLDDFVPIEGEVVPDAPLYWVTGLERGDEMANWSPDEALPAIRERGRHPLTVSEGISWLLQEPQWLERNRCFMTIASRKPKAKGAGLDSRTPALWISNGTGRDGAARKGAPKVGWCWAGNRHTWLGFASAAARAANAG